MTIWTWKETVFEIAVRRDVLDLYAYMRCLHFCSCPPDLNMIHHVTWQSTSTFFSYLISSHAFHAQRQDYYGWLHRCRGALVETENSLDLFQPGMTITKGEFLAVSAGLFNLLAEDVGPLPGRNSCFILVVCFGSRGFKYLRIYVHMSLPSSQMVFLCISIFPDFLHRVWFQFISCTNKGFAQRVAQITNTARVNEDREKHWTH